MKLQFEKCMERTCYKNPLDKINEKYINIDNIVKSMITNVSKNGDVISIRFTDGEKSAEII